MPLMTNMSRVMEKPYPVGVSAQRAAFQMCAPSELFKLPEWSAAIDAMILKLRRRERGLGYDQFFGKGASK